MATAQLSKVIEHLRSVLGGQDAEGLGDGDLLRLYVRHRDEAAFEALVRRHGPMVMGVCRRVLHNSHDTEDAFQATFLVLVRKASTLRSPGMVGNWLYGVAYRTALEARKLAAKRQEKEAKVLPRPETPEDTWADLWPVLDQELERLPEKYRAVIVLCDLEEKTRKEAAQQLGCPLGTVASRLSSARVVLAKRLGRHGVTVSGGLLGVLLSQNAWACVPNSALSSTIKAASLFAAGKAAAAGLISAEVATLTERVMKAMVLSTVKTALVVIVTVFGLGTGVGLMTGGSGNAVQTQEDKGKPAPTEAAKLRVQELIQQLDADEFQKREQATNELKSLGKVIVPQLEAALERNNSPEVRRRLEQLLAPYQQIRRAIWFVTKGDDAADIISVELQPNSVGHALAGVHVGFTPGRGIPPPGVNPELFGVAEPLKVAVRFGDARDVAIAKDAVVVIDGREGKLAEVKKGMQVSFQNLLWLMASTIWPKARSLSAMCAAGVGALALVPPPPRLFHS